MVYFSVDAIKKMQRVIWIVFCRHFNYFSSKLLSNESDR